MGTNTSGLRRGGPGRPKGAKNKKTIERNLLTRAADWIDGDAYFQNVKQRVERGKAPHMETYFAQRLHGKAVEKVELSGNDAKPIRVTIKVIRG